jgi:hypothetical protein
MPVDAPHEPMPSQICPLTELPTHAAAPHEVPTAYNWHAPLPSHCPSCWHVVGGSAVHSLSGSIPLLIAAQVPSAEPVLAATHAWHSPPQGLLQQTPSMQKLDWHCDADVHGFEFGRSG